MMAYSVRQLCLLATMVIAAYSCPTDETLKRFCFCQSSFNGISLDCSGANFNETMELLKPIKGQLGLVQELLFRNSTIGYLPARAFEGFFVKKLDLSNSDLTEVDPQAFKGLENVLQILYLKRNRLREVPTEAMSGLTGLLQLDLSNNSIGNLATEVLFNVPKLYDLNLADNHICKAYKDAFKNVKYSLQTLNLGGNCLTKVPASALRGFQQLLALHLHNNRIPQLEPLQFMNMPALYLVNLAGNEIQKLHRQAFLNVPNLKFLYLGDNLIEEIEPLQFRPFETLELLDLSRNRLVRIPSQGFSDMPRLSQLYLTGNQIEQVEGSAFANSSLVILLLNDNRLHQITAEMFFGLGGLQQFSLRHNQINFISQNAFYQLPSLVVLDLSYNNISSLFPATFLAQLSLFMLDLSHNRLTSVPYGAFNQRIATVVLQENPLVCSERIHILQNNVGIFVPGTIDKICSADGDNSGISGGADTATLPPPFLFAPTTTTLTSVPSALSFPSFGPITPVIPIVAELPNVVTPRPRQSELDRPNFTAWPTPFSQNQPVVDGSFSLPTRANVPPLARTPPVPLPPVADTFGRPNFSGFSGPNRPGPFQLQTGFPHFPPTTTPFVVEPIFQPTIPTFKVTPATTTPTATLPPGIVTATFGANNNRPDATESSAKVPSRPDIFLTARPVSLVPPEGKTPPPPKKPEGPGAFGPTASVGEATASLSASTTIAVCLTVVIVVMLVVFVTLCVVRHRHQTRISQASSQRTAAYLAAQHHSQQHYGPPSIYGTGTFRRETPPRPPSRNAEAPQNPAGWLYAPAATYASASSYYK